MQCVLGAVRFVPAHPLGIVSAEQFDKLEFVYFFSPCKTIEITVKVMMLMSNTAERK